MSVKKVYSGLLEFNDELKVMVAVDEDADVKKAVTIDEDGAETSFKGTTPTGKKEITSTAEVNVASYATAQVVDADLVASNIKKDVDILGIVGSYEGGGSSPIATPTAIYNITINSVPLEDVQFAIDYLADQDSGIFTQIPVDNGYMYPNWGLPTDEGITNKLVQVLVYDDTYAVNMYGPSPSSSSISMTGDITYDSDEGMYHITGDCTITVSAATPGEQ